jgi:hypothetical protein
MSKVQGTPFRVAEIEQAILDEIVRLESGGSSSAANGKPVAANRGRDNGKEAAL